MQILIKIFAEICAVLLYNINALFHQNSSTYCSYGELRPVFTIKDVVQLSGHQTIQLLWESLRQHVVKRNLTYFLTSGPGGAGPWNTVDQLPCRPIVLSFLDYSSEFAYLVYMCILDLEKVYEHVPWEVLVLRLLWPLSLAIWSGSKG